MNNSLRCIFAKINAEFIIFKKSFMVKFFLYNTTDFKTTPPKHTELYLFNNVLPETLSGGPSDLTLTSMWDCPGMA